MIDNIPFPLPCPPTHTHTHIPPYPQPPTPIRSHPTHPTPPRHWSRDDPEMADKSKLWDAPEPPQPANIDAELDL